MFLTYLIEPGALLPDKTAFSDVLYYPGPGMPLEPLVMSWNLSFEGLIRGTLTVACNDEAYFPVGLKLETS